MFKVGQRVVVIQETNQQGIPTNMNWHAIGLKGIIVDIVNAPRSILMLVDGQHHGYPYHPNELKPIRANKLRRKAV